MDLGLFGWYPLIDRKKGMYMQIAQSVVVGLNATNPGCEGATYLRIQVKPFVDRALGHPLYDDEEGAVEDGAPEGAAAAARGIGYDDTPPTLWAELQAALDALEATEAAAAPATRRSWLAAAAGWAASLFSVA